MSDFKIKIAGAPVALGGGASVRSPSTDRIDYTLVRTGVLFERWASHMSKGAAIYGKNNWRKSTESTNREEREAVKARCLESAARHFEQWLAGKTDEDHAAAVIFNLNWYETMVATDHCAAEVTVSIDATTGGAQLASFSRLSIVSPTASRRARVKRASKRGAK